MNKEQLLKKFKNDLDLFMEKEKDEFEIRRFVIDFCYENKISADEISPYIENAPVWDVVPGILTVIGAMGTDFIVR